MSQKPKPLEMLAVRVSKKLRQAIKAAADRDLMPVSVWVRIALHQAANGKEKKNGH